MNEAIREQLSAYVDGELPDNEAELLIRRVSQDRALRTEVAKYLAIGRVLRDDVGLAAADRLHERVAASLAHGGEPELEASDSSDARSVKPLVGIAIAATVAAVGLFALQQTSTIEPASDNGGAAVAEITVPAETTRLEMQRQYFLNHADATTDLGANGMNSRFVALEFDEEPDEGLYDESDKDESDTSDGMAEAQ